jgi:hypothetical protein
MMSLAWEVSGHLEERERERTLLSARLAAVCSVRWGRGTGVGGRRYRGTVITPVVLPCRTPLGYFGGTGQTLSCV